MSKRTKRRIANTDSLYEAINQIRSNQSKPKSLTAEFASRARSIDFVSSVLNILPNPDPVLRKKGCAVSTYETLLYDGRVKSAVNSRKSAVKQMEWDIVPGDFEINEDILSFYRNIFDTYKMQELIAQILDTWLYGYKVTEILWGSVDGKIVPVKLVPKPSEWFKFTSTNELRMLTKSNPYDGIEIPANKFVLSQYEADYKNPYGVAVLSSCFWPVTFRSNGLKFWTIFLEKYGMPFLLAHAEQGAQAERISEVADILEDMVQDAIAVVPKDYEVQLIEATEGKGKADSFHAVYLDYMNREIDMSILSTNLTTEVQGGSYAASKSHMEVREDIIKSDSIIVEQAFQRVIDITHSFNFTGPSPAFKLFSEEKIDKDRAERDVALSKTGLRFTSHYYQRAYNLTEDDFEITEPLLSSQR